MRLTSFDEFTKASEQFPLIPVYAEILGDLDTPVSTFLKTTSGPHRFLLESVEGGTTRGRYSIIGDTAIAIFKSKDGTSNFENLQTGARQEFSENPLDLLKSLLQQYIHSPISDLPFINGGFFGYLGYDVIRYIERLPDKAVDDTGLPDIFLFIPQKIIVFDNLLHKIHIILFEIPDGNLINSYENAVSEIKKIVNSIRTSMNSESPKNHGKSNGHYSSNTTRNEYEEIVRKAKKHIRRGDVFQIVLSQRLEVETDVPPFDVYRDLRVINPSPYMFYMELDGLTLLGSSPETLVKLDGDRVYVKPIAGTRKRGADEKEDESLIKDLLGDAKECAEHTMLVDLGRNDVGRIAEYGSVTVDELMGIEKYSHVIHIVSTVSGKLKPGLDAVDVFKACFPAGTVSGAPKVRAMELIEEMEPTKRGIYAGAVGYFAFDGKMDVCIAIRTIYIKNGKAFLQAGAGIIADSQPAREYEETLNKAKGLLKAIEYAEGGLI